MREYGLTILVAAAVTYLFTPLVRRFAIAVGAKHAARARDVHTEPVPLLGGIAMYLGLAAALLVASRLTHLSTVFVGTRVGSGLLLAGGLVVLMGIVDDRWGLGAITKMAGQVGAGAILVWSGAVVAWLPVPGGGTLSLTSDQQTVLTILVVVVTINAVNFIDGLDGLAAGIVGIGAAAFFLYYYTLTKRLGLDEQTNPALASAILAGVCLGFLPHNFHPARIFMGDTGSMLLGLLLAYAPISSLASLDPNTLTNPSAYSGGTVNRFPEILPLLVPAIIMLIPYADLLLAVVRRTRAGQSPFSADKKHLQHRLLAIGHSHRASVLLMYLWAALFAGTVVLLSIMRTKLLVLAFVTLAGVLVLLLASMPRLRPWNRRGQLRLATGVAGPVPSAGPGPSGGQRSGAGAAPGAAPVASPVPSGTSMTSRVPAPAGVAVPGRSRGDRVDGEGRGDLGARLDRGLGAGPGPGTDPGPPPDRGLGAAPGYQDAPSRATGDANAWHDDAGRAAAGYEHVADRDGRYTDAQDAAGEPGPRRPASGRDAPPAAPAWDTPPPRTLWNTRPGGQPQPPEAPWDARPAGASWDSGPPARERDIRPPAETGPAHHGLTTPAHGDSSYRDDPDRTGSGAGRSSAGWPNGTGPDAGSSYDVPPDGAGPGAGLAYGGPTGDAGSGAGRSSGGSPNGAGSDDGWSSGSPPSGAGPAGGTSPDGGWLPESADHPAPGQWYSGRAPADADPGRAEPGRPDGAQWYPGRPEPGRPDPGWTDPGEWHSGRWDRRVPTGGVPEADAHQGGPRDADPRDASLYAAPPATGAGPHDAGLYGAGPQTPAPLAPGPLGADPLGADPLGADPLGADPLGADPLAPGPLGPDSLGADPLAPGPGGSQPPGARSTRPADHDGDDHGEPEDTPLLPWRFR